MIGVQMTYNDFNYETGFPEPTMILNTISNGLRQWFLKPTQLTFSQPIQLQN